MDQIRGDFVKTIAGINPTGGRTIFTYASIKAKTHFCFVFINVSVSIRRFHWKVTPSPIATKGS